MTLKKCSRCKQEKDISLFYKSNDKVDGHLTACKRCLKGVYKKPGKTAEKQREYYHKRMKECPDKMRARAKLKYALKIGKVKKPTECSQCSGSKQIEGHHEDYSKPLDVLWLCNWCHSDLHQQRGTFARRQQ